MVRIQKKEKRNERNERNEKVVEKKKRKKKPSIFALLTLAPHALLTSHQENTAPL